jgi:phosphoglycolate phosphatase
VAYDNLDAIVWDLDGTLIDSAPDLAAALNTLLQEYSLPALPVTAVRKMIGNGVAKLIERGFHAHGKILVAAQMKSLLPQFMKIYSSCATELTRLYPGARDALQEFRDKGFRQAMCTNKPERVSRLILDELALSEFFEIVVGGDTTPHKKPHALPLQMCLDALRTERCRCLLIGDSAVDVATARAAGIAVGIVTHGYARTPVSTLGADFLISDLSSLPADLRIGCPQEVAAQ